MGQIALGFRSLFVKVAIFFAMASLLAWALGGTLWPRAESADLGGVDFDAQAWYWRISVGGREENRVRWQLMVRDDAAEDAPIDERTWAEVAGPVVGSDGMYYGTLAHSGGWSVIRRTAAGEETVHAMPDRLAVERQLARVDADLPVQAPDVIEAQRPRVLAPDASE